MVMRRLPLKISIERLVKLDSVGDARLSGVATASEDEFRARSRIWPLASSKRVVYPVQLNAYPNQ
ncbi:uncharacterized protein PGTG_20856 [Puccinia graminis f. sp. tritici CRL 75-36-700-3]|uniref:Uncharacterized protein n=1 Tax=Puccinia graminis f. sp. tritici (strain CRL 75-36-700-3 / race SCCL) TaxID=418459 RepID=H6QPI9_PUCGT|nr:uncharacterized protein PGTG_20856 [Puccinia graminis f. sp. tritici CRL 75-36-700-3]EHS63874.1 hypothetical protein PGTG_20856 [Puccinia graminis f. sp. tritici CRL 75-36-700-3]